MKNIIKKRFWIVCAVAILTMAGVRFFLLKQYCSLCLAAGYDSLAAAPGYYFADTVTTLLPGLF